MILIADAGGNKTDWAVLDGQSVYRFESVGFNAKTHALEPFLAQIPVELIQDYAITHLFFYGAGVTSKLEASQIANKLKMVLNAKVVEVNSDILGAARAVLGNEKGFVGILGTGSAAAFYNGRIITHRIPSLGYLLGDEGSGVRIGSEILKAYLRNQLPHELSERFNSTFPAIEESYVLDKIYREPKPNLFLSQFTSFCSEHISHDYVKTIVRENLRKYFEAFILPEIESIKQVGFTGSVAAGFSDMLQDLANEYHISISQIIKSPIEGLIHFHHA